MCLFCGTCGAKWDFYKSFKITDYIVRYEDMPKELSLESVMEVHRLMRATDAWTLDPGRDHGLRSSS